ncbi:hypothetical protein NDU88_003039 [Pleurodeles waltl]|uniref:Myotubularin phosphatase domain-containing protein n=1 Tax=Pleurodeles waltl TaxID=8319 RepID=A0AAV7TMG9_PLEWA|nr:hypothetical protein NDU88_003039 [Pleurodeles waltl]
MGGKVWPPSQGPGCVNTSGTVVGDDHLPVQATASSTDTKLDQILRAIAATKPMFPCFLIYRDKETLLRVAQAASPLHHDNARVLIFPDYILFVQCRRASLLSVNRKLQQAGLCYSLLFPRKLKVMGGNKTFFFTEPTDTWDWVEQWCYEASSPSSPGHQHCSANNMHKKRQMLHCCPKIPVQGAPSMKQAEEEQAQALTIADSLWGDRCLPQYFSLDNDMADLPPGTPRTA